MSCIKRAKHFAVVSLAMYASSDAAGHKHRHLQLVRLSAGQGVPQQQSDQAFSAQAPHGGLQQQCDSGRLYLA